MVAELLVAEVSHNPPGSACHIGRNWISLKIKIHCIGQRHCRGVVVDLPTLGVEVSSHMNAVQPLNLYMFSRLCIFLGEAGS